MINLLHSSRNRDQNFIHEETFTPQIETFFCFHFRFDETRNHVELDYPRDMQFFTGLDIGYNIDATFQWTNGNLKTICTAFLWIINKKPFSFIFKARRIFSKIEVIGNSTI